MRIAIFGSAFNPPTLGHLDAIQYLLDSQDVDKVMLVPSYAHAFGKNMLDYTERLNLLEQFILDINHQKVELLAIEHTISDDVRPVYTFDLMDYLQTHHFSDDDLMFVVGPDNLKNWHKFYRAQNILGRWQRLVVPERINVRSTQVREYVANGRSIQQLTTKRVADFISKNHSYR